MAGLSSVPAIFVKETVGKDVINMEEKNKVVPFCIKLADIVVGIEPLYEDIKLYCSEYITEEVAEFHVKIEKTDIDFERIRSEKDAEREGRCIVAYSDA